MTFYIKNGSTFSITKEENIDIRRELPVGTYSVMMSPTGFYLDQQSTSKIDHKIYGSAENRADRIIKTFFDRPASTGVVLQGEKGSGKTLLARLLSEKLREQGVSTLLVNSPFAGESFNNFIGQIEQPIMILFDEFEKVYDKERQTQLLTLLDGTHSGKKLFVATLNDFYMVNDFMKNRPGRFYYSFRYEGLEEAEVRDYCKDNLRNQEKIDSVVTFSSTFSKFNFDILKAIVEEMNRYDEAVGDVVQYLNARPQESSMTLEIKHFEAEGYNPKMRFYDLPVFNPFTNQFTITAYSDMTASSVKTKNAILDDGDDEDEGAYIEVRFRPGDLQRMSNGQFFFKNDRGAVILGKPEKKDNAFKEFMDNL